MPRSATEVRSADPGDGPLGDPDSGLWVSAALEAALRARAPGVQSSTPKVRQLAMRVGRELGLDAQSERCLDLSARVRDVGMIALPDSVGRARARLSPSEWELVHQHPVIGATLLESLSVVAFTAEIVRAHHERWDGAGYPDGLRGDEIPLLSRVIATCDAFVAMADDRPYRRGMGAELALDHVSRERGVQLDPQVVDALVAALAPETPRRRTAPSRNGADPVGSPIPRGRAGRPALTRAIDEFELVPAFAPAYERALAATTPSELLAAIESDTGLTVAVLRQAQAIKGRRRIANVAEAVDALSSAEVAAAINTLPRAEFPWRSSHLEALMQRSRVHAQAVTRAVDRIVRNVTLVRRDDVLVAALLHDIGKLVLGRARPDYTDVIDTQTTSPEARVRLERQELGIDHASLGGLLLRRWGLPEALAETVAAHHTSEAENEVASYVRLADMIAHHGLGETIDRGEMVGLCHVCGVSPEALRDVLFDLPHSGGSQRRRADPSPLSSRETEVLRILAQGKLYKVIAQELGVTPSTRRAR
jgi:putative nucleotidyltransferase with HDIG domain